MTYTLYGLVVAITTAIAPSQNLLHYDDNHESCKEQRHITVEGNKEVTTKDIDTIKVPIICFGIK